LEQRHRNRDPARRAQAAAGYLAFLPQTEEALSGIVAQRPEGLLQAREIVRALAAHLVSGEDLLQPIRQLKGHDDYTFTHALNVCVLSTALGRVVGAPEELLDVLGLSALCHDLGKQRIPDEILNKRGKLEPEERQIMDDHAALGARLLLSLSTAGQVHPLLPVVAYQHHMGADRSGYPRIPVCGKPHAASLLVAVADVFDALRTVRPYRGAWSTERTCTILLEDGAAGKLHGAYVSALFGLLNVLTPGRQVELSDGQDAVVLESGASDPLRPKVETGEGEVIDLGDTSAPRLVALPE
jgi:HD-GYP domain-containing protein (c-di-GMP phosphodiesterase class II)